MSGQYPVYVKCCFPLFLVCLLFLLSACPKKNIPGGEAPSGGPYYTPGTLGQQSPSPPGPAPSGTFRPYVVRGKKYYPLSSSEGFVQTGIASWYGKDFHGKKTSNGEIYNMYDMTCAHKILPMNTYVRITNLGNNKSAILRVNDRGPFVDNRIVDLSHAGAEALDVIGPGTAMVRLEAVRSGQAPVNTVPVAQAIADAAYYIQIGSFQEAANAARLLQSLQAQGFTNSRIQTVTVSGTQYSRVQAGTFRGLDHANEVLPRLKGLYPSAFVLTD